MGKFAPVFLAYLLNCIGVNIFRENTPGCEPLVSCLIFLTAVFILLWDVRLYPTSLRKLSKRGNCFLEFLLADFIMEHIMADFWFPLEASMAVFLPRVASFEKDLLKQGGWESGGVFCFLAWDGTLVVFSYLLSFFFFFGVLHATRVVDFRLLTFGVNVFFRDVLCRLKKFRKKFAKILKNKKAGKVVGSSKSKSTKSSITCSDLDIGDQDSEDDTSDECLKSYFVPKKNY